jgi:hypothetical protein
VAHNLDIPIRFRFLRIPAIWEIRTVNGRPHHREREFAFSKLLTDDSLEAFELEELNGWDCRDAFFRIPEGDKGKLLEFLKTVGVFSNLELSGHWSDEVTKHCREGHPVPIDVRGIWKLRDGLKRALLNRGEFAEVYAPPLSRPRTARQLVQQSGINFPLRFEVGKVASGVVTTTEAYHMLLATVFADVVRGTRFKTCEREDCGSPFPITSEHSRKFCCQYCGHLVSQRKKRERDKKKREMQTKQETKRRKNKQFE